MADETPSSGEELKFMELLESSALNDYPNPERAGCPGPKFLRKLASNRKSISLHDPRLDHVVHCSPCFAEYAALRDVASRRSVLWNAAFAAAAAIVLALVLWLVWLRSGPGAGNKPEQARQGTLAGRVIAQIDLQNRSVSRGSSDTASDHVLQLPRARLDVTILLPVGSELGNYEVQILKTIDAPIVIATADAHNINGTTELRVPVDLSSLPAGNYLLGVRRRPWAWSYHPLQVK